MNAHADPAALAALAEPVVPAPRDWTQLRPDFAEHAFRLDCLLEEMQRAVPPRSSTAEEIADLRRHLDRLHIDLVGHPIF